MPIRRKESKNMLKRGMEKLEATGGTKKNFERSLGRYRKRFEFSVKVKFNKLIHI